MCTNIRGSIRFSRAPSTEALSRLSPAEVTLRLPYRKRAAFSCLRPLVALLLQGLRRGGPSAALLPKFRFVFDLVVLRVSSLICVFSGSVPPKLITSDYKSTKRVATFSPTTYVSPCGRREPECGEIQAELRPTFRIVCRRNVAVVILNGFTL